MSTYRKGKWETVCFHLIALLFISTPLLFSGVVAQQIDRTDPPGSGTVESNGQDPSRLDDHAFDNNEETYWRSTGLAAVITYKFAGDEAHVLKEYSVTSASGTSPDFAPKSWNVRGSNTGRGGSWTIFDRRGDQGQGEVGIADEGWSESGQKRTFRVQNDTAYKYIRIRVLTTNTAVQSNTAIGEIEFFDSVSGAPTNVEPTDITLSNSTVAENTTTVGTLSTTDADVGDTHEYSLVSGTGSSDNSKFTISENTLSFATAPDFETPTDVGSGAGNNTYTVRVQTEDPEGNTLARTFTITVTDVDETPTDTTTLLARIGWADQTSISNGVIGGPEITNNRGVARNSDGSLQWASNGSFRYLLTQLPDLENGESVVALLKAQAGSLSNYQALISANESNGSASPVAWAGTTTSVRNVFYSWVPGSNGIINVVNIVSDTLSDPTQNYLTYGYQIVKVSDNSYSFTYLVSDGTNKYTTSRPSSSRVIPTNLTLGAALNRAWGTTTYSWTGKIKDVVILKKTTAYTETELRDLEPADFYQQAVVSQPPTDIALSNSSVAENTTTVGTLSTTDADVGDTHEYSLVSGTGSSDNSKFTISENTLSFATAPDFETPTDVGSGAGNNTYTVRVQTEDPEGNTLARTFTITVTDVDETPTDTTTLLARIGWADQTSISNGVIGGPEITNNRGVARNSDGSLQWASNGSFRYLLTQLPDLENGESVVALLKAQAGSLSNYQALISANESNGSASPVAWAGTHTSLRNVFYSWIPVGSSGSDLFLVNLDSDTLLDPSENYLTYGYQIIKVSDTHYSFTYLISDGTNKYTVSRPSSTDVIPTNLTLGATLNRAWGATTFSWTGKIKDVVILKKTIAYTETELRDLEPADFYQQAVVSQPPTEITLSNNSVAENTTTVGTLSTVDADSSSHTYSLVSGTGSSDNSKFTISENTLSFATAPDFETPTDVGSGAGNNTYTVRVQTEDPEGNTFARTFTITVTDVNEAPTNITLSSRSVVENTTDVGTLSTVDKDSSSHTYSLVSGTGSSDNSKFTISGSTLSFKAANTPDFEIPTDVGSGAGNNTYTVRIETNDGTATFARSFTITVTDVNEAPTNITLSSRSVVENTTVVGTLSTTDVDAGDSHTYSIVESASSDGSKFTISGNTLSFATAPDYENPTDVGDLANNNTYSLLVRTTDLQGGTTVRTLTVTVINANEAPTDIALSKNSAQEGKKLFGALLSTTDVDAGDTHRYFLVSGTGSSDNSKFIIQSNSIFFKTTPDFENPTDVGDGAGNNTYTVRVQTRDSQDSTFARTFTITVTDVDETLSGRIRSESESEATRYVLTTRTITTEEDFVDITYPRGRITQRGGNARLAFDNIPTSKWSDDHRGRADTWVTFYRNANPHIITKYTITSADTKSSDPLSWVIQGSNDESTWTIIDTRSDQDWSSRGKKIEFDIEDTSTPYSYIRLKTISNKGGGNLTQIAEIEYIVRKPYERVASKAVGTDTSKKVSTHGFCRIITNNQNSNNENKAIFVPVRTRDEIKSFVENAPSNVPTLELIRCIEGKTREISYSDIPINGSSSNHYPYEGAGNAVTGIGDLDGDDIPDIAIAVASRQMVHILFMNRDSTVKSSTQILASSLGIPKSDRFGSSIANIGDLDGVGTAVTAIAVGAPGLDPQNRGGMYILFMNSNGTVNGTAKKILYSGIGLSGGHYSNEGAGEAIVGVGNINSDDIPDIAIAVESRKSIHILFMNRDGTVKSTTQVSDNSEGINGFGSSIANLGDLDGPNGEGVTAIAVGAPRLGTQKAGAVYILFIKNDGMAKEDRNGNPIFKEISYSDIDIAIDGPGTHYPNEGAGEAITGVGDLDGDGIPELAIAVESRKSMHVLFMNANGTVKRNGKIIDSDSGLDIINSEIHPGNDRFGTAIANVGDINSDGVPDFAVAAPRLDSGNTGGLYMLFINE